MPNTSAIFCLHFLFLSSHPSSNIKMFTEKTISQYNGNTVFESSNPANVGSDHTLGYRPEFYLHLCFSVQAEV
jgi:hypothetical protein